MKKLPLFLAGILALAFIAALLWYRGWQPASQNAREGPAPMAGGGPAGWAPRFSPPPTPPRRPPTPLYNPASPRRAEGPPQELFPPTRLPPPCRTGLRFLRSN